MKKALFLALFSTPFLVLQAQIHRYEIGVNIGPNLTRLHGNGLSRYYDWRFTFTENVSFQYNLTKSFALYTNIAYESKGCTGKNMKLIDSSGTNRGSNNPFDFNYQYLTMPVLIRYITSGQYKFFVNAGPYVGYLLKYVETLNDVEVNRTSDMHKIDLGFTTGIGTLLPVNDHWSVSIELRNSLGFYNVRKSQEIYQTAPVRPVTDLNPVTTTSTSLLFGAHYLF
jgi:hypothetical protein